MANTYKRLGAMSSSGVIGTADTLYNCGTARAVVSSITVCNTSASAVTYTLCLHTAATFAASGYLVYQAVIGGNDTVALTLGITMDPTNKYLLCSASSTAVSFSAFGSEIT